MHMPSSLLHRAIALTCVVALSTWLLSCAGMGSHFNPRDLPQGLQWTSVDGIPIIYRDEGQGDPILILTPYPFSTELWSTLAERMKGSARLIIVEPIGLRHPSSMGGDFSTEHLLQIHRQFIRAIGLEKVHVIGVGESGALAVAFGHHFPQYTTSVVSINGFESVTWTKKIGTMMDHFNQSSEAGLKALLSKSSIRYRTRRPTSQEINRLTVLPPVNTEKVDEGHPVHLRFNAYSTDIKGGFIAAMMPSVHRPLLLLRSEGDELLPEKYVDRTRKQIRRVRVRKETIPGAGHFAFLDQPEKVAELILEFHRLYPITPDLS